MERGIAINAVLGSGLENGEPDLKVDYGETDLDVTVLRSPTGQRITHGHSNSTRGLQKDRN